MGRYVALIALFLFMTGCTERQRAVPINKQLAIKAIGQVITRDSVRPPKVVNLDTCPTPQVITVVNSRFVRGAESSTGAQAQDPATGVLKPALFSVNLTNYGAEQGLYSLVNAIKRDKGGNFWFGTGGGGVIRFDGKTATTFTTAQGLASNNIRCIAEDKKGNFWFGSHGGGVSYYDGRSFRKFTKANGLGSNNIRGIVIDTCGNVLIATYGGGISVYDGKVFSAISMKNGLVSDNVNCITQSVNGGIWCGTDSGVTSLFIEPSAKKAVSVANFSTVDGLGAGKVISIAEDRTGRIWMGTEGGGLSCLTPNNNIAGNRTVVTYTIAQGLAGNVVKNIFEDIRGRIWFCTTGGGVSCYDPSMTLTINGMFTTYSTDQGLYSNKVECVAEDENGNLWFGTDGGGVSRFDGEAIKINVVPRGVSKTTVTCISGDRTKGIWLLSNEKGIAQYDGKYFLHYGSNAQMKDIHFISMLEDRSGRLWFGTGEKGVFMCDQRPGSGVQSHFKLFGTAQGLQGTRIWSIAEDNYGRIWLCTGDGVSCYDGKRIINYTTGQGLGSNAVWCSLKDKDGNMWFGTFGGGLSKFIEHPADGGPARFMTYTMAQGLPSNSIKSIAQDKNGNIWLGTGGGGVSRFDGNSFINYTTINGLSNNIVVSVGEDKNGYLWFGTNEGLTVLKGFKKEEQSDSAKQGKVNLLNADNVVSNAGIAAHYVPVFEKYNFRNGYPLRDVNTNSMYIDSTGVVWAGTADRLIKFDHSKLNKNVELPHVVLNAVKIGGEKVCWYDLKFDQLSGEGRSGKKVSHADSLAMINEELRTLGDMATPAVRDSMCRKFSGIQFDSITPFYPLPVNLVLPYKHNNITFDFAATELARPYLVKYQYILEGYDKEWNPVTDRTSASFGNIHEGVYTFKLKAQSPDGVWSAPVVYSFEVLPPLYRTWWSYVLYCLGIFYVVYAIVHRRTVLLKKENAYLETIVAERTAQIEQEKAAVLLQANDLKKLNLFKDKAFSILSHDLRGPISTSAIVISMLDDDEITMEEFKKLKEGVVKQLNATGTLLDNLLRWAKGSMEGSIEPKPGVVNVYEVAVLNANLFEESLKAKNISLVNNVPEQQTAYCDYEHIDIVVRNLLANAIKFANKKGTIEISATAKDRYVMINVADDGVGMTSEQMAKLFKPVIDNTTYGTAGEKGTGLGLLLCYDFIRANKGDIKVASAPGKGTTFTVVLPVNKAS